ncbi:hypothetical protein ACHWQZ_G001933 [Mnemiopsis leidyi]
MTLEDYRKRDTESSDSRAGTSTPPQTPPIPYTPVVKEFTIKETSPINNEVEKKSSSPNLTEGEEQEPPTPTFRVGICLKSLNTTLEQADLDNIRLILLKATLETPAFADLEVTNNITDIKGNKIIIKTKNFQTINLVRHHECKRQIYYHHRRGPSRVTC